MPEVAVRHTWISRQIRNSSAELFFALCPRMSSSGLRISDGPIIRTHSSFLYLLLLSATVNDNSGPSRSRTNHEAKNGHFVAETDSNRVLRCCTNIRGS